MTCCYCEEPITDDEIRIGGTVSITTNSGRDRMHRECLVRSVAGSVTHIRGDCWRSGGTQDCHACEYGMSRRDAARASFRLIQAMNARDDCAVN